jgi:hypothetical protein
MPRLLLTKDFEGKLLFRKFEVEDSPESLIITLKFRDKIVWSFLLRAESTDYYLPNALANQLFEIPMAVINEFQLLDNLGFNFELEIESGLVKSDQGGAFDLIPVGKLGEKKQNFSNLSSETRMNQAKWLTEVITAINQKTGLVVFPTYGTLLGIVRDNRFISHDNDMDIAFLVNGDVIDQYKWMRTVERAVTSSGYTFLHHSDGHAKILAKGNQGGYSADIFPVLIRESKASMWLELEIANSNDLFLPLRLSSLEGVTLFIPRKSEELLRSIYGEAWRVPDPTFTYEGRRSQAKQRFFYSFFPENINAKSLRYWNKVWVDPEWHSTISNRKELCVKSESSCILLLGVPHFPVHFEINRGVRLFVIDESTIAQNQYRSFHKISTQVREIAFINGPIHKVKSFLTFLEMHSCKRDCKIEIFVNTKIMFMNKWEIRDLVWCLKLFMSKYSSVKIHDCTLDDKYKHNVFSDTRRYNLFFRLMRQAGFKKSEEGDIVTFRRQI